MPRPDTIKRWSLQEDEFILTHGGTMSRREMMDHLPGRTEQAIKARCSVLNVGRVGPLVGRGGVVIRKWTPEEEEKLAVLCGRMTLEEAAETLGRTKDSLKTVSKRMSLSWRKPRPKKVKAKKKPPKKKVKKKTSAKAPKPRPAPKKVAVNADLIRSRTIFAKAYVFLEKMKKMKKSKAAISMWGVMSQLGLAQPWGDNPDRELILEAAEQLGMRIYEENGMVMMK